MPPSTPFDRSTSGCRVVLKDGADFGSSREKDMLPAEIAENGRTRQTRSKRGGLVHFFGSFRRPYFHALDYHLNSISFFPDHISRLMELVPANPFDRS
jgi:hypothetical protein